MRTRIILATAALSAGLLTGHAVTRVMDPELPTVCVVASEDSSTAHCDFNPAARYDFNAGAWREVDPATRYANGNRPPTGQYLTDHPTPDTP